MPPVSVSSSYKGAAWAERLQHVNTSMSHSTDRATNARITCLLWRESSKVLQHISPE